MAPGPEAQLTRSRRFRRNTESLKVCPGLGQIVKLRRTLNPISKWQVLHPDPGLLLAPYVHSLRAARVPRVSPSLFVFWYWLHKPIHCFRTGGCVEAQFDDALRVQGCFRNGSAWGSLSMPFVTSFGLVSSRHEVSGLRDLSPRNNTGLDYLSLHCPIYRV